MEKKKNKYVLKSWVPTGAETEMLMTEEDVQGELEQLRSLQPENRYEIEEVKEETIEDDFWLSNKGNRFGVGVKVLPVHRDGFEDEKGKIDSITIATVDHENGNKIVNDVEIYETEFDRLFQFVDLLKKEVE